MGVLYFEPMQEKEREREKTHSHGLDVFGKVFSVVGIERKRERERKTDDEKIFRIISSSSMKIFLFFDNNAKS